jgi:hypothetical protein
VCDRPDVVDQTMSSAGNVDAQEDQVVVW